MGAILSPPGSNRVNDSALSQIYAVDKIKTIFCLIQFRKFGLVCSKEVKFHLGSKYYLRYTQVSALECPPYRRNLMRIGQESGRCQIFCPL